MGIKIKETIKSPLKKVQGQNKVQVGIFGDGKLTMLANIFENGGGRWGNTPSWSPLKTAAPKILEAGIAIVKQEAAQMITNGKDNTLKKVALEGAGILKETIEGIKSPGNKESTIKKKGFDNPMVDSGKFKKAASGKVNGVGTFGKGKLG